ncbi:MAG: hypothetical protein QF464_12315 [Myxococcota bacterium]|nr:hypothetical protein [Myxococcota bacterium]
MARSEVFVMGCIEVVDYDLSRSLYDLMKRHPQGLDGDFALLLRGLPDLDDPDSSLRPSARTAAELQALSLGDVVLHMLGYEYAHSSDKEVGWFTFYEANEGPTEANRALCGILLGEEAHEPQALRARLAPLRTRLEFAGPAVRLAAPAEVTTEDEAPPASSPPRPPPGSAPVGPPDLPRVIRPAPPAPSEHPYAVEVLADLRGVMKYFQGWREHARGSDYDRESRRDAKMCHHWMMGYWDQVLRTDPASFESQRDYLNRLEALVGLTPHDPQGPEPDIAWRRVLAVLDDHLTR